MSEYIGRHREYLVKFMKQNGLNANSWAKKANISEGTLRAYLSGRSQNISLEILHKMAKAASVSVLEIIENSSNFFGKKMNLINILIIALMLATLITAIIGFIQIVRKDQDQGKRSNKLMVLRITLQTSVILLICLIYFFFK